MKMDRLLLMNLHYSRILSLEIAANIIIIIMIFTSFYYAEILSYQLLMLPVLLSIKTLIVSLFIVREIILDNVGFSFNYLLRSKRILWNNVSNISELPSLIDRTRIKIIYENNRFMIIRLDEQTHNNFLNYYQTYIELSK